jgi:hypothetical protein
VWVGLGWVVVVVVGNKVGLSLCVMHCLKVSMFARPIAQ